MSHYSSSSSARTPGLVLGGVVTLGVTAALSLPFPLLGGLLITPALLAAAVTGYLNRPSSRFIALSASAVALLIDLLSVALIFTQPSADLAFLSALHSIYGLLCFLCALAGTAMLWLGRRRVSPTHNSNIYVGARTDGTGRSGYSTDSDPVEGRATNVREDLARVGTAAAQGARKAIAAWEMYQRVSEPRRERAAARADRRERRREEERMRQRHLAADKRGREEDEIHKARLRQAREVNSRFWS